jgi:hypothetical protein
MITGPKPAIIPYTPTNKQVAICWFPVSRTYLFYLRDGADRIGERGKTGTNRFFRRQTFDEKQN